MIPSILSDIDKILASKDIYFKYLPIKNIYIIAPENVREKLAQEKDSRLIFVHENEFIDAEKIKVLYSFRTKGNSQGHSGWYIQQFIKMQFARFTQDEYYLIWDSDTIPLRHINMFDESSRPYFDMKTEYHAPYFDTIRKILPDIYKAANGSFISEHMLIRSEYMREMLDEIESRIDIEGNSFQEKIINAIDINFLRSSGFSEFETYGNYVILRHQESYILREWHSLRNAGCFYKNISYDEAQWLKKYYDAVSLEKWQKYSPRLAFIVKTRLFRLMFSPAVLQNIQYGRPLSWYLWKVITLLFRKASKLFCTSSLMLQILFSL